MPHDDLERRSSGLLLHPTSLPSSGGIGDLGAESRRFIDFLVEAGQRWWQMLPIGPTAWSSPYHALSAFAGNPLLISLEDLHPLLDPADKSLASPDPRRVDFGEVRHHKLGALRRAHQRFLEGAAPGLAEEHAAFLEHAGSTWLSDFALFAALKARFHDQAFVEWPEDIRMRQPAAVEAAREELRDEIAFWVFLEFVFERQWAALRTYARARSIRLLGDVPIFVSADSADVWAHPEIFRLDASLHPAVVAGVPPDYFSEDGQLWGNPHYDWEHLKASGYDWWVQRFRITLERFDAARVDHFIGFYRVWEIPREAATAKEGQWAAGPRDDFFQVLRRELGALPIVAEDLGLVTDDIRAMRDRLEIPGLKVLHFAFDNESEDTNEHRPHNYPERCVVYTGTHDNNTTVGWWAERPEHTRRFVLKYGAFPDDTEIHWKLMDLAMRSSANMAIFPVQDLLGLGAEHRMNRPGTVEGNWEWRLLPGEMSDAIAKRLKELTRSADRLPQNPTP